ncbi:murein transglycosylase A [Roseomonas elaeocarpi]|uniref:peptidoglycan lytic exotransglycosylase n=1 Tax=Roseomonas elaeocarpi TaxID=907779 RepID=A0ABV6JPK3_9PROT
MRGLPDGGTAQAREVRVTRGSAVAGPRNMVQRRLMMQRQLARREAIARGVKVAPLPAIAGLGGGGGAAPSAPVLVQAASWRDLPGWDSDRVSEALPALLASCRSIGAMSRERAMGGAVALATTADDWRAACAELSRAAGGSAQGRDARLRAAIEASFTPNLVGESILTGYYEPVLRGSLTRGGPFQTPLYAPPAEHVQRDQPGSERPVHGQVVDGKLVPLPDRAAIQDGALEGRGLELAWVDDPVDAFFLQIQGSGRIALPDGKVLRLGFAGQNGQPYRAVGRSLIESGALTRAGMSAQAIRDWMRDAGPEKTEALMAENPSYIFFQPRPELRDNQGPIGAMGIPLTPERSVAVDPSVVPLGAPVFVAGPNTRRLLAAQDTGGAIRGPGRGDLFRGWGDAAGAKAGTTHEAIRMWVLVPRQAAVAMGGN